MTTLELIQETIFDFKWERAPLTSFQLATVTSIIYVAIVLIYAFVPGVKNIFLVKNLKPIISVHNVILSGGSLIMLIGALYEVIKRCMMENSIVWIFCEHPSTQAHGMLWFWSYVYYLSKYYELLDTIFQFLSGKTPPNFFLHVYHHSLVIFMSWFWIDSQAAPQFTGIIMNTGVHVIMYYYFYLKSIGISPKWKSYVTLCQIVQFICSIIVIMITLTYAWNRRENTVEYPQCKGINVVIGSLLFNITLLNGFVDVLMKGIKGKKSSSGGGETNKKIK